MTLKGLLVSVVAKAVTYLIENIQRRSGAGIETVNVIVIGTDTEKGIERETEKGIETETGTERGIGSVIETGTGTETETGGMIMITVPGKAVEGIMRGAAIIEKVVPVGAEVAVGAEVEAEARACTSGVYKVIVTVNLRMGARRRHLHPAIWLSLKIYMVI